MIFISLCLAQSARAEPKYIPKVVPRCTVVEVEPGRKLCVYSLEDVKALYGIDTEIMKLQRTTMAQGQKIILQSDIINWQQKQLELSKVNAGLFHKRMNSMTNLYIKTDKKLQNELAKPKWGSYVAWGLVAVLSSSFLGYVIADQVSK